MNTEYKVFDNFLEKSDFELIEKTLLGSDFDWHYNDNLNRSSHNRPNKDYYFIHLFFDYESFSKSKQYDILIPLIKKLKIFAIARIKANLYPGDDTNVEDPMHIDNEMPHTGAIFYINTNNGYTKLEDGTKIQSVANRLLIFDASRPHCSARCTDEKVRVNINFNYCSKDYK